LNERGYKERDSRDSYRERDSNRDRDYKERPRSRSPKRQIETLLPTTAEILKSSTIDFSRKDTSKLPPVVQKPNKYATPVHTDLDKSPDTIYISNLPKTVTEESLVEFFGTIGVIKVIY
jgi:RNA recognition motif-containing protein